VGQADVTADHQPPAAAASARERRPGEGDAG
jgi:hypothetical protein